jgi:hypothetical protein
MDVLGVNFMYLFQSDSFFFLFFFLEKLDCFGVFSLPVCIIQFYRSKCLISLVAILHLISEAELYLDSMLCQY